MHQQGRNRKARKFVGQGVDISRHWHVFYGGHDLHCADCD